MNHFFYLLKNATYKFDHPQEIIIHDIQMHNVVKT